MSHASDLDWFLSTGMTRFFSSPFGRILDIQQSRYRDPSPGQEQGGYTRRSKSRAPSDHPDPTHFVTDWQLMHVKSEEHGQTQEPELAELHRFGHVSSVLYKLEKLDPILTSVLMLVHGDRGQRWAAERIEGRLLSIYSLTPTGSRWVAAMVEKSQVPLNVLRPDERMANECAAQDNSPLDIRRARLKRVDAEAKALYVKAMAMYEELAA